MDTGGKLWQAHNKWVKCEIDKEGQWESVGEMRRRGRGYGGGEEGEG